MTLAGWRRIIRYFLRLARSTALDRSIFKDMALVILFLLAAFSIYSAWEHRLPPPQLTYIPYAAIDKRGVHVTGFAFVTVDLTEPVPMDNLYQALIQIETMQDVRQARPLVKLVMQRPKGEK